jgi:plastocyanin
MPTRHPLTKLFALLSLIGCGETVAPSERALFQQRTPSLAVENGDPGRRIFLRDHCVGDSWLPFGGCLIDGSVERPDWLARVQETGSHPLWRNSPIATAVETGMTLEVVNVGGRGHTFTRVENFGGGRILALNTRDDTRIPAPECLRAVVNIGGAGGSVEHTFTGVGEQRYQCCFHPWMRTTVQVTDAHGN